MLKEGEVDQHTLQCMEIWGGIEPVERSVSTPGLDLWVFSQPFEGDEQGGDVYYVTLCGGGLITRIVVADVSGHGSTVAEFSSIAAVVVAQEHQSEEPEQARRAAQPAVRRDGGDATVRDRCRDHLSASVNRLSVCNAGHPRPLYYAASAGDVVVSLAPGRVPR